MLTPDLEDIVKREKNILGLSTLLDPKSFVKIIQPFFPEKNLENMIVKYIRYKPGMNCLVLYELKIDGKKQEIYAKAFGNDKKIKIQKSQKRTTTKGIMDFGRIFLEDKGIMVGLFPNDNKIKSLKLLDNGKNQERLFSKLFPQRKEFWKGEVQTLQYKPEKRYGGVITTKSGSQATIKFYDKVGYLKAKNNAHAFKSKKNLGISQCLGHSNKQMILVFEWINGKDLGEVLLENPEFAEKAMANTGKALAKLHSQKIKNLDKLNSDDELLNFSKQEDLINFICPHLKNQFKEIRKNLQSFLYSSMSVTNPIHGDFNPSQVIIDTDRNVTLIDFDRAVLGDPRLDLGNFIAHLYYQLLFRNISTHQFQKLKDVFLNTYLAKIDQTFPNLEKFIAAGLLKMSNKPFRTNQSNWVIQTEQILNMIKKIMGQNRSEEVTIPITSSIKKKKIKFTEINTHTSLGTIDDSNLPHLQTAMNGNKVEPYLNNLFQSKLGKNIQVNLRSVKKIRHKLGKRCLIEYDMDLERKNIPYKKTRLLGKMHRKGLDKTTFQMQNSFQKAGFDSKSSDKISLPEVIGVIPEFEMWLQKKIEGIPMINLLVKKDGEKIAGRIAEAIHKVHLANIPIKRHHTVKKELLILNERLTEIARLNPSLSPRINHVLDECKELVKYLPISNSVGIHRDFYHDQVLVNGHRIFLLDFDLYCMGDPSLDIGNFVGHLQEFSLRKFGNPNWLSKQEHALIERFLELSGEFRRTSVEIYTTLTLVRHISISQQFSDRRPFTESLLSLCEDRLHTQISTFKNLDKKHVKPFQKIPT
jgi:aminoglycoside phosphotransferase (APT) family kinase protein